MSRIEVCPCPICGTGLVKKKFDGWHYWCCPNEEDCLLDIRVWHEIKGSIETFNQLCKLVRWGEVAKELAENPPKVDHPDGCDYGEHKGIWRCIDRLKAAMEEK